MSIVACPCAHCGWSVAGWSAAAPLPHPQSSLLPCWVHQQQLFRPCRGRQRQAVQAQKGFGSGQSVRVACCTRQDRRSIVLYCLPNNTLRLQAKKGKRNKGPGGGWYNVADASDFQVQCSDGPAFIHLCCSHAATEDRESDMCSHGAGRQNDQVGHHAWQQAGYCCISASRWPRVLLRRQFNSIRVPTQQCQSYHRGCVLI